MSAPDLQEVVTDFLESWSEGRMDRGLNQDEFELWMDLTRVLAWDIPSALSSICQHTPYVNRFPMHWGEDDEDQLSRHFKKVHNLEFTDRINWEFDT